MSIKTKETEITEADYLAAKKLTNEFELKNIPKFYAKLSQKEEGSKDTRDTYFDDIDRLVRFVEKDVVDSICQKGSPIPIVSCCLVSKIEFDKFYLPF